VLPGSLIPVHISSPTLKAYKTDRYNAKDDNKFTTINCQQCVLFEWKVIGLDDQLDVGLVGKDPEQAFLLIPAGMLDGQQGYRIQVKVQGTGKWRSNFYNLKMIM